MAFLQSAKRLGDDHRHRLHTTKVLANVWLIRLAGLIYRYHSYSDFKAIARRGSVGMRMTNLTRLICSWCNVVDRKKTYSGDEGGWINDVDKSCISRKKTKFTWLDHVQLMIYRSRNHDITIVFPFERELSWMCRHENSLVENLLTHWETGEEIRKTNENIIGL